MRLGRRPTGDACCPVRLSYTVRPVSHVACFLCMIPILIFLKLKETPHSILRCKDILFFDPWAAEDVIGRAVILTLVKVVELSEAILLWLTFACVADDIVTESAVEIILVILVEFSEAEWLINSYM